MIGRYITAVLFCFFVIHVHAQERLSLQDAIGIALKNNYSILISGNNYEIAKNNNTVGNAGMLPSVEGVAGNNKTVNDTKQEFSDGRSIDKSGINTKNVNAGAV